MIRINLLPFREARRRAELRNQLGLVVLAIVVSGGLCVLVQLWSAARLSSAKGQLAQIEQQISDFEPEMNQLRGFEKKRKEVERKLGVIRGLEKSRTGPVRALDDLATNTPDRLWLTSLKAQGSSMNLQGFALDNEVVADFLTALGSSQHFGSVDLKGTEFVQSNGIRLNSFTVEARLTAKSIEEIQAEAEALAGDSAKGKKNKKGKKKRRKRNKKAGLL